MKINKIFGAVALSLCFGFINADNVQAANQLANENLIISPSNKVDEVKDLPNFDKASASEIKEYFNRKDQDNKDNSLIINTNNFGLEYKERLELAKNIEKVKKANNPDNEKIISESIDILNSDNIEYIKNQSKKLADIISLYDIKIDDKKYVDLSLSSIEESKIEESLKDYLEKGILFEDESEFHNLHAFEKSILNSKSYELADDKTKDKYNEVLYDVKKSKLDDKDAYKVLVDFVNSEDKLNFDGHLVQKEEILENKKFNSSNESTISTLSEDEVVETTSIENQSLEAETTSSEADSAFLKNEKIKDKYQELTEDQKRELDLIDTDKNGQISDSELDNSANFSSNLDKTSWLYPFTDKAMNDDNKEPASQEENKDESQESTEATSPENNQTPKTVTIDDNSSKAPALAPANEQKEDSEKEKEEFKESKAQPEKPSNTNAASVVRTGIQGLGIVVIVLVVAIIAYILMKKNSKDMRK